ncbi:preprotein translocase subunit YajC [bacterium]|nr:preprotein translocase subunit YajC [bacterium]
MVAYAQQTQTPAAPAAGAGLMGFLPIIFIVVIFYLLIILPQQKKDKQHRKMTEELKKGDRIITSAGICGKVVDTREKTIIVEVASNVKIEFLKSAVASKVVE